MPVAGTLDIVPLDGQAETYVVTADSERLFIVWPAGFSATTANGGAILDEEHRILYAEGEAVELSHVDRRLHAGTKDDPVKAAGILEDTCYVPLPDRL
jgi:hypothetical protein